MQLHQLQKQFAKSVFEKDAVAIAGEVKPSTEITAEQLIDVYRNNVLTVQTNALMATFPAITRLLGEEFFRMVAGEFIKLHKSKSGNLDDYGEQFPGFLQDFEHTKEMRYLYDVARFEWLYNESELADKSSSLEVENFKGLSEETFSNLRLKFTPHAKLFVSEFPVFKIWQRNVEDKKMDIDLGEGGDNILIVKPELKPDIYLVDAAEIKFLQTLQKGKSLYEAFEEAEETDGEFSLENSLQANMMRGVFMAMTR